MGDSVSVSWVNGPTEKEIKDIINIYQYGSFNSYEDMYENTNRREDIPQTKYVSTSREISEDLKKCFQIYTRSQQTRRIMMRKGQCITFSKTILYPTKPKI